MKSKGIGRGGARTGAGRKKGSPNKRTQALQQAVEASGVTPLEFLLSVMRDEGKELGTRLDAAKAAAQYVHAKLQPVDGKTGSAEVRAHVLVEFQGPAS